MEATVTIICGMILAFQSAWITYRLKQQDNARDAARGEIVKTADEVRAEALRIADELARDMDSWRNEARQKFKDLHDEVTTINGATLAQLADAAETRRVDEIPKGERKDSETQHIATVPPADD